MSAIEAISSWLHLPTEPFFWRALLAGLVVVLMAGPLGCFVVWQRLAYFGNALSHGLLLGVALGFALHIAPMLAVLAVTVLLAVLLFALERVRLLAADTLLGILAHAALAVGVIVAASLETLRVDLMGYLFGDLLAVSWNDVWLAALAALAVLGGLALLWRPLLALTVHEPMAAAEGVQPGRTRLAYILLLAVVIALAMKLIGILLITALLIIPAATARAFARTPEQMALLAVATGGISVLAGLAASWYWDWPAGPAVVAAASLLFGLSLPWLRQTR